ncbi:hypothetical protein [Actinoplanes sp. NPDC051494]|uniref:hypothetical protein n=1 Tax=Actinoplanes sp. NPDC051494 TaxID=3363907 RepID=UPI0037BC2C9A
MAYLFPPMDDEPPADYLGFATARAGAVHHEAHRLTGGDRLAAQVITMEVLTDLAGHWRRLRWQGRLSRHDARARYLTHRLATRTGHWRDEQLHPVEVTVDRPAPRRSPTGRTVALRLAAILPTTVRDQSGALAEAEIAWVHAYRRYVWHCYARVSAGSFLLVFAIIHFFTRISGAET